MLPSARCDPEDRVIRGDPTELRFWRVGTDAVEEHADLELPALEVGAQEWRLLAVGDLSGRERLRSLAEQQATPPARPQVTDPLGVPARSDEVPLAVDDQEIDRGAPRRA